MTRKKKFGHNDKEQKKLEKIVKKRGCTIGYQYSHGRNVFLHIAGKTGIDEKKDRDVVKLYINCDRKNIALLTGAIYGEIRDIAGDKLQMKCITEQFLEEDRKREESYLIKNYQRNDKIVIYAENDTKAKEMSEKINQLNLNHPELFSESKTIPLLRKNYGFIGYGKEKRGAFAKTPVGMASGRTYNDYMSDIMFHCIVAGFDDSLSGTSSGHAETPETRMSTYAKIYENMLTEQKKEIINKSKEVFLSVCRENKVNTIYTPVEEKVNQNRDMRKKFIKNTTRID